MDDVNDSFWCGDAGRVIDGMCFCLRVHALRHVALRLSDDHPVVFGNQKPAWNVLPKRAPDGNSDAVLRDRPLHGGEQRLIRDGRMLCEGGRKGFIRQPDQAIVVWRELWRLGMRLEAIEEVRDFL